MQYSIPEELFIAAQPISYDEWQKIKIPSSRQTITQTSHEGDNKPTTYTTPLPLHHQVVFFQCICMNQTHYAEQKIG